MRIPLTGRRLAAGVLALYALVAGVLLPMHALEGAVGPEGPARAGVLVDAWCQDRDCHDPGHGHGAHAHDPATCGSCAHAKVLASPVPSGPAAEVLDVPRTATRHAAAAPASNLSRARPPARGPPSVS